VRELREWADGHQVTYTVAAAVVPFVPGHMLPKKVIVAIAAALALGIAAVFLTVLKGQKQPSFSGLLRDPRLAKVLGMTPSKLAGVQAAPAAHSRPAAGSSSGWQLLGRTSSGQSLKLEITDEMFAKRGNRLILGRTAELCDLVVKDDSVSRQHAHLRKEGQGFVVADRNSSNRTAVNGQFNRQPFEEVPLQEGDTLTLGEVKLDFNRA
jgi:hypothetical protein